MTLRNRFARIFGLALSLAVLAGGTLSAEAKSQMLTERKIENFCDSIPEVKAIALKGAKKKGGEVAIAGDRLSAVLKAATDKEASKEVSVAVQAHGFANVKEWASVGESIVRAYAHIKTAGAETGAQKKVNKAIRKIEKNKFLSDKQKENLIEALRDGADEVLEPPPAENVAAVKPMVGKIEAVMQ